tara:strand:+ start:2086 stop:2394 length:309 start_codon:yes stop_codon:yes gene_type:complete
MEIRETETGLYTTITKVHTVTNRVNIFWTHEEALRSLNRWKRIKYRLNRIKAMTKANSFKIFSRVIGISFALLILISLISCGSTSGCSTKATNRGGGYYINR